MKGKSKVLAGVLFAAAAIVAVATWLRLPDEPASFAPPQIPQLVGQAQSALANGEVPLLSGLPLVDPQDDDSDQKKEAEEEPPRRPVSYRAVHEFKEDGTLEGESVESTGVDESAVAVLDSHASVLVADSTIERRSPSSTGGLLASTYGVGSALLAAPGQLSVARCAVSTNAAGGSGLFALGKSEAFIADSSIATQQSFSGGLVAVEGASLCAWDTDVRTEGESSPAASVGSKGGTMVLQGGTLLSSGQDSPVLSSKGDLTALDVSLSASKSCAVAIEGKNTVRLYDCRVSSNPHSDPADDCLYNVVLYQGSRIDASTGRTTFQMTGGRLSTRDGGLFYVTNTQATIVLQSVEFSQPNDSPFFLRCSGNAGGRDWGTPGNNGSVCSLTGINQVMEGDILWDSLSQVTVYLTEGSRLVGAVRKDDSFAGNPTAAMAKGQANLIIDKRSSWTVTGDSVLSSLSCEGVLSDAEGRPVTIKSPDGATFVKGTSPYTVTVTDFSIVVDVSSASPADERSFYEVERPEVLAPALEEAAAGEETQAEAAELEAESDEELQAEGAGIDDSDDAAAEGSS